MSNLNRHPVRRTAAGVLASALAFSGAFAAGTPAFAAPGFTLDRLAGADRYATSAAIAAQFGSADGAILASGENRHIVDALSASFLAGIRQDPVVLTAEGQVSAAVLAQLNALTSKNVTIVGGEMAVSAAVEAQLRDAGFTVTRLAGDDRYETSEEIIRKGVAEGNESPIGILVSGQSPVDALAAGALAYKGDHPVFLTAGGTIPPSTLQAMQAAGTTSVIIVGGTTVVPESVRTQLASANISVATRLGGVDRSETSRLVADFLISTQGFSNATFNVASGANNGVDALSGAALSGKNNTVLLVTNTATDPGSVDDFATARAATLTEPGRVFGGEQVVAPSIVTQLETAGGAGTTNQTFNVTPTTAAVTTVSTGQLDNTGRRSYTVSNPVANAVHSIALLDATNVNVSASGQVTFDSATPIAANSGVSLEIVEGAFVQAAATGAGTTYFEVTPTGGELTFSIDSVDPDANVVPVVFFDANADNMLNLNADGTPVTAEAFGAGGMTEYLPAEAADNTTGTPASITAARVDTAADRIVTDTALYNYDSNDTFRLNGVLIDQARFEALLSAGDVISVVYRSDAANTSTFNVTTDVVAPPSNVKTTVNTVSTGVYNVVVNWTASAQGDVTYTVTRTSGGTTTVVATDVTGTSVTDQDVPDGTYVYTVVAEASTSGQDSAAATSESVVVPPVAPVDPAPAVLPGGAVVDTNTGAAGATAGDVWNLVVGEDVTTASSAAIQVTSGGNSVIVENGVNGTITTTADGDVVVITLNSDLTGIAYPATVQAVTGIADSAGQALVISADTSLEDDGPEIVNETADTGETTFTVAFNEAVIEASAENVSNYDYVSGTGVTAVAPTSATLGADGRTVTLVVPTAVAAGASVSPAGVVDTDGQASTQGMVALAAAASDTTPPTFNDALSAVTEIAGDDTLSLVFSEAINCSTLSPADITVTNTTTPAGAITVTLTSCGTDTAVFSIPDAAVAAGENLLIEAVDTNDVADLAGNVLPAAEQTQDTA